MITFVQFLSELFGFGGINHPYLFDRIISSSFGTSYYFKAENNEYHVLINRYDSIKSYYVTIETEAESVSSPKRIYATILKCVEEQIQSHPNYVIEFIGDERKRKFCINSAEYVAKNLRRSYRVGKVGSNTLFTIRPKK